MEENKGLTIAIIGIVAVTAIVGLVFLFSVAKTGAGVYGGALKGNMFPYTRFVSAQPVVETPGWEEFVEAPATEVYGGASRLQENTAIERQVSSGFRYNREIGRIPTALTTCIALDFRDDTGKRIFAPLGVSRDQLADYENIKEHCFRYTADGTPVSTIIANDACCTVR